MSFETQPITPVLEAAAEEALGGPAARPPQPLPMGDVAGRTAFEARHAAAQAAAGPPAPLGNPTFDPAPSELLARRAKVGIVRDRLGNLARLILSEQAALAPILADLADDSKIVRESEAFDVATAGSFLAAAADLVTALSAPAKPDKKKKVES
jgi:hypothetical protein